MFKILVLLACLAGLAVVVLVDLPSHFRFAEVVQNWGHAPVFGLLALAIVYLRGPPSGLKSYAVAAGLALFLGIAVEVVQVFLDRDATLEDMIQDALGIVAMLAAHAWLFRRRLELRRAAMVLTVALVSGLWACAPLFECAAAYWRRERAFPVLADFQSPLDLYFIRPSIPPLARQPLPVRAPGANGEPALLVPYSEQNLWPGVVIEEPHADWSGYSTLSVDVWNANGADLKLELTVHDRVYNGMRSDRFDQAFVVPAHERFVLKVPLQDIARGPRQRTLDLREIWRVAVVQDRQVHQPAFFLNRIWLD